MRARNIADAGPYHISKTRTEFKGRGMSEEVAKMRGEAMQIA
jgi:hypothetical protein